MRTLLDRAKTGRPERRTTLILNELAGYKVQIDALSETRLPKEGRQTEQSAGYIFFWIGLEHNERLQVGADFDIKSNLVNMIASCLMGINDPLMNVSHPPLPGKKFATLIIAYAPTITNLDELKDRIYEDLKGTISVVPRADKLSILGDFNACVGRDHLSWEVLMGKYGVGNGLLLLEFCATQGHLITNTVFRLPKSGFLFADDCAINASTQHAIQGSLELFLE